VHRILTVEHIGEDVIIIENCSGSIITGALNAKDKHNEMTFSGCM